MLHIHDRTGSHFLCWITWLDRSATTDAGPAELANAHSYNYIWLMYILMSNEQSSDKIFKLEITSRVKIENFEKNEK